MKDVHCLDELELPPGESERAIVFGAFGVSRAADRAPSIDFDEDAAQEAAQKTTQGAAQEMAQTAAFTDGYVALIRRIESMIPDGLSAAVYARAVDGERTRDGLMSRDRGTLHLDAQRAAESHRRVLTPIAAP